MYAIRSYYVLRPCDAHLHLLHDRIRDQACKRRIPSTGPSNRRAHSVSRITSYNVCYTKLLRLEKQANLFKPFNRLYRREKGHGLGLSIVRRIVERMSYNFV